MKWIEVKIVFDYPEKKIRYCFFEPNESKKQNCVSAWPATPHIEALIRRNQYPT